MYFALCNFENVKKKRNIKTYLHANDVLGFYYVMSSQDTDQHTLQCFITSLCIFFLISSTIYFIYT